MRARRSVVDRPPCRNPFLSFVKKEKCFIPKERKIAALRAAEFSRSENSFFFGLKHFLFVKKKGLKERGRPWVQIPTGPLKPFLS